MTWVLVGVGLCAFVLFGLLFVACRYSPWFRFPTKPDVSVLLVVRDQAPIIEGLVKGLLSFFRTSPYSWELVVVDESSRDETPEILRRLQRKHSLTLIAAGAEDDPLQAGLSACRGGTAYYMRLNGKVELKAAVAVVRCLAAGGRLPECGVYHPCGVIPGTSVR